MPLLLRRRRSAFVHDGELKARHCKHATSDAHVGEASAFPMLQAFGEQEDRAGSLGQAPLVQG